jgi:hypothetical protein
LPRYSQFALAWTAAVGWDAAVEARDSVLYHGNTLLHSSNGLDWTRLPSAPLPEGAASGDDVYAHGGVATTSGRRVVWQVRDKATPTVTSLSTSADGTTWTVIPAFNGAGAFVQFAVGPTAGRDGPWLLAGRGAPGSTAWFTNDLAQWHASSFVATEGGSVSLTALERWVGGYIALGTYDPEAALPTPVTWLSPDGMTWNEIPPTVPPSPDGPVFLAMGPAGMIGIGNAGEDASTAWLAH